MEGLVVGVIGGGGGGVGVLGDVQLFGRHEVRCRRQGKTVYVCTKHAKTRKILWRI